MNRLFTIGHSTHPAPRFIELLRQHGVTAVCDIRSRPYSRRHPQFNRKAFEQSLADAGMAYVFLGKELGGRPEDPACYADGRVQYERVAGTAFFADGMRRLEEVAQRRRAALVCAEKEPLDCHRALLVGREAHRRGWQVCHILHDGGVETQEELVARLLRQQGRSTCDLFEEEAGIVAEAYRERAEAVAFRAGA